MKVKTNRTAIVALSMVALAACWMAVSSGHPHGSSKPKDWPMWGGSLDRNMVNPNYQMSLDFQPIDIPKKELPKHHVRWTTKLGSQSYANPVVAGGRVYVGTNNGGRRRPKHKGDRGCVLVFDERTGEFLWQLTCPKLAAGRVNDWPEQGICSTPFVENDRLWVVTNRAELVCMDTEGFYDGENDGSVKDEADNDQQDADVVWRLDMIEELGVFPHNLATSSPIVFGDLVYIVTSNGVEEAHKQVVSPRAPCFIAVNKKTGKLVWENREPFDKILHGQWSSPTIGIVNGQPQIYFPGGDGWLYALEPKTGNVIWKFDLNPKDSRWLLGSRGTRNNIISTAVFIENSVVISVGQDPDHGNGVGHMYRIDATGRGDVSPTLLVDAKDRSVVLDRGEPFDRDKGQ
ncbi:MAG: outer membrane protein assembly factor BamB, partial [Pirellulaceae bacterium]